MPCTLLIILTAFLTLLYLAVINIRAYNLNKEHTQALRGAPYAIAMSVAAGVLMGLLIASTRVCASC